MEELHCEHCGQRAVITLGEHEGVKVWVLDCPACGAPLPLPAREKHGRYAPMSAQVIELASWNSGVSTASTQFMVFEPHTER